VSENPKVKLAVDTHLAFTEAHLKYLNCKIFKLQYSVQVSVLG